MRWWIENGKLWIQFVGLVETVAIFHRFDMPDPNTLVLHLPGNRCRTYKRGLL